MWADRDPIVLALRAERMRQNLTILEVAQRMGLKGHAPLQRLEGGHTYPQLGTLRRWAAALGCDIQVVPPGGGRRGTTG